MGGEQRVREAALSGTERLRETVLRSWRDSPTRLTEDTHVERDLRVGSYRDRLFVELAANAADAAATAGRPGTVRVRIVDGELRVANTGAPLDDHGVAALASLRASAKPRGTAEAAGAGDAAAGDSAAGDAGAGATPADGSGANGQRTSTVGADTVGRFGVGFAAVLVVTANPRVVSTTGGVAFSEHRTRAALSGPEGAPYGAIAPDAAEVPVLRLPWPLADDEPPLPPGFDTEVRLPLRGEIDADDLLDRMRAEAADVLLMLPWLAELDIEGDRWSKDSVGAVVELTAPGGRRTRWLTHRDTDRVWAVPVTGDDEPLPLDDDVLHAPTPTDERLSLPARLLSWSVPLEPSRRRVLAGAESPEVVRALDAAATSYPGLVRRLPAAHRTALVPGTRFPLSDVDGLLRDRVTGRLTDDAWVPAATGTVLPGARVRVLELDAPALVDALAEVVPDLAAAPLCGPMAARSLRAVGARPLGVAELVDAVTGVHRPPEWWRGVYAELLAAVERGEIDLDELGALPVPLTDGRTVPGPRGTLLPGHDDTGVVAELAALEVTGLHIVATEAAHPLLERLGAVRAGPGELLAAPGLAEAVHNSVADALAGADVRPLVEAVLRLVAAVGGGGPSSGEADAPTSGALALPSRTGWRRADELLLPEAALLDVLDPDAVGEDAAVDVVESGFAARWGAGVLTAVGVLDTFRVSEIEEPGGFAPDDDSRHAEGEALPIADLDLVADDRWPEAVRLLAARPATWHALTAPDGRVRAWLARNALLAGRAPRQWRLRSAGALAGLFDPVPDVGLGEELLAVVGVRAELDLSTAADVAQLCARLSDPGRAVAPGPVLHAHSALAAVPPAEVDPPDRVRALDGSVVDADDAVVLDGPWLLAVWPPHRLVAARGHGDALALADVLDLPLASDETTDGVDGDGEFVTWSGLAAIVEVADLLGLPLPDGGVVVHTELTVGGVPVPWWVEPDEPATPHATDTPDGLARAFAWAAGRWDERALLTALLDDPDPRTLLG